MPLSHFLLLSLGKFNGIIGMVERGEADLSAALLIINEERAGAVNFSLPISLEPYTLMFQRPQEESRALLFIYPFQPLVCTDNMILLHSLYFQ